MQPALKIQSDLVSIQDYLDGERVAENRHEYFDGTVRAMAGESPNHGKATTNLVGELHRFLKGKSCEARFKDTKVRSGPGNLESRTKGMFSYPDVMVICGEAKYYDDHKDVVLNPKIIIEVLSPSTEDFDRGTKFHRYWTWNPSLMEYVLVEQDQPMVQIHRRISEKEWKMERVEGLDSELFLESIQFRIPLRGIYDRIEFPAAVQFPKATDPAGRQGINPPSAP